MEINWVFLIAGALFLIPFYTLISYYRLIKTREYLLAAGIFLFLSLNAGIIAFLGYNNLAETITVLIAINLILIVNQRTLGKRYNKLFYSLLFIVISLSLADIILLNIDDIELTFLRYTIFEIIRLCIGFYLVFAYSKIEIIIRTDRTRKVKNTWIITGIVIIMAALYRIGDITHYYITADVLDASSAMLDSSLFVISISALFVALSTGTLSILFPEIFLLSQFQVAEVDHLYKLADQIDKKTILPTSSQDHVVEYLRSIDEMMKSEE